MSHIGLSPQNHTSLEENPDFDTDVEDPDVRRSLYMTFEQNCSAFIRCRTLLKQILDHSTGKKTFEELSELNEMLNVLCLNYDSKDTPFGCLAEHFIPFLEYKIANPDYRGRFADYLFTELIDRSDDGFPDTDVMLGFVRDGLEYIRLLAKYYYNYSGEMYKKFYDNRTASLHEFLTLLGLDDEHVFEDLFREFSEI